MTRVQKPRSTPKHPSVPDQASSIRKKEGVRVVNAGAKTTKNVPRHDKR